MNIDSLTLGEIKQIQALALGAIPAQPMLSEFVGKYCIVRCRDAGVHAGIVKRHQGRDVVLEGSRRLWYWKVDKGHTLTAVAEYGVNEGSKLSKAIPIILLADMCELIPATKEAQKSIQSQKVHRE